MISVAVKDSLPITASNDQWLPHIFTAADNRDYFQIVIEQLITDTLEQMERQLFPLAGELHELADCTGNHAPTAILRLQA